MNKAVKLMFAAACLAAGMAQGEPAIKDRSVLVIEVIKVRKDGIYLCMYNFGDKLPYDCVKLDFSFKEVWREDAAFGAGASECGNQNSMGAVPPGPTIRSILAAASMSLVRRKFQV